MSFPFVVALALVAAEKPSVAVVGFQAVEVSSEKVAAFAEVFADELAASTPVLKVTSAEAIAKVLGVERQRQLLGCSNDSSSCLSEIVGALGPAELISGSVVKVGDKLSVSVRVSSARDGHLVYGQQTLVEGEAGVLTWLKAQAPQVGERIAADLNLEVTKPVNGGAIAVTAVAGVAAVSTVVFFALLDGDAKAFAASTNLAEAQRHARTGSVFQVAAWASLGVAVAASVTAVLLWVLPTAPVKVGVVVGGDTLLTVGGSF